MALTRPAESVYSVRMADSAELHHALRAALALRDKVVVLRLLAAAYTAPEPVAHLAVHLALLRALGVRLVVILDAPEPAARLAQAIAGQGQRALLLPATGIISVPPPAAGAPALPMLPVSVDPVPLGQLTAIGYIPLLLLPLTTETGAVVSLGADDVAAAVGLYLDAALLVFVRARRADAPPLPLLAAGRPTVVTSAESPAGLLAALLLAGRAPEAPEKSAKARRARGKS